MNYNASAVHFKSKIARLGEYFKQRRIPNGLRHQIMLIENHLWARQHGMIYIKKKNKTKQNKLTNKQINK